MASDFSIPAQPASDRAGKAHHAPLATGMRCALDELAVLAVGGADAAGFLNGQFSSDINALRPGESALTSYSDARGRVLAIPRVFVETDRLLLVVPSARLGPLRQQLAKYVLRADVQLEDRSGHDRCLGIAGDDAGASLEAFAGTLPAEPWQATALPNGGTLARMPGARPRWLACGPVEALEPLWHGLDGIAPASAEDWRLLEIEAGLPNVYSDTAERFVAQMLNLDRLGAVDFRKGCYPGQEVIARTHYLGRIKRRMHVLRSDAAAPPPGAPVYAAGETAGEIVDAAPHPEGGSLALAVLRLDAAQQPLGLGQADGPASTAAAPPYGLGDE